MARIIECPNITILAQLTKNMFAYKLINRFLFLSLRFCIMFLDQPLPNSFTSLCRLGLSRLEQLESAAKARAKAER